MFTVYILYSPQYGKSYTGFTSNVAERLKSHNELGHKGWTRKYRPWELVFTETYETKAEAMDREKWLKTGLGREFVKDRIDKWLHL